MSYPTSPERDKLGGSNLSSSHHGSRGHSRHDRGLQDISKNAVCQLTSILIMSPEEPIAYPSDEWLRDQKERVRTADCSLKRPHGLTATIANLGRSFNVHSCADVADLCPSHAQLDPQLIRHLKRLIVGQCARSLSKLRKDYDGASHHPDVAEWLDRLQGIREIFRDLPMNGEAIEEDANHSSRSLFQKGGILNHSQSYRAAKNGIKEFLGHGIAKKGTCEACICAAVGGDQSMLAALLAGIRGREKVRRKTDPKSKLKPRLLRALKSWVHHYHPVRRETIRSYASYLEPLIAEALERASKEPRLPRQPNAPQAGSSFDATRLYSPERTIAGLSEVHVGSVASRQSLEVPLIFSRQEEDVSSDEELAEILRTSPWQGQRPDQTNHFDRRGSAIPRPLNISPPHAKSRPTSQNKGTRENSWATVTVHTERPLGAGVLAQGYPPPPPPLPSFSYRPTSSAYGPEAGFPPPSPSVATSNLPFAPAARVRAMADHNLEYLNQGTLSASTSKSIWPSEMTWI